MKKERGVLIFLLVLAVSLIYSLNAVIALNDTSTTNAINLSGFDLSYSCLKNQVNSVGVGNMSNEQLAYSLLALGYDSTMKGKIRDELEDNKNTNGCWPKNGCKVKETAEVILAYNHIGKDTTKAESWLNNQSKSDSDLIWYMEIDANNAATCKLSYDSSQKTIKINVDKTLSGSLGTCFSFARNGYWLQINPTCYGKQFKITCDNDFLTALVYKTKTDETYYVSALTHTAAVNGETVEKVESYCFKDGSTCSYEASLWAALAMQAKGKDVTGYLPYLMAMTKSNERYMPYAFLYSLTGFDEYYSNLVEAQNPNGYWQETSQSKRYYDTALGLLALYGRDSESFDKALTYLLSPNILGNGCWNGNNIGDTALILYASHPKIAGNDDNTLPSQCEDFSSSSYSCGSSSECSSRNGTELSNYKCFGGLVCCDKSASLSSCSNLGGSLCNSDERCNNGLVKPSSDSQMCCVDGTCVYATTEEDSCVQAGNSCRTQCLGTEEADSINTCTEGVCCSAIIVPQKSYWWLWLLIILVILLALAIVFRDKVKIWWFQLKSKFTKTPIQTGGRPNFPNQPQTGMNMPRRLMPSQMPPQRFPPRPMNGMNNARPFPKDRELDDTLRKIKDIGKK